MESVHNTEWRDRQTCNESKSCISYFIDKARSHSLHPKAKPVHCVKKT